MPPPDPPQSIWAKMKDAGLQDYLRPIAMTDAARPQGALAVAGGPCWFDRVEVLNRSGAPRIIAASDLAEDDQLRLSAARADFGALRLDRPRIMGILNITPDSFSDGGLFLRPDAAVMQGRLMASSAEIIDIGGESTRPGADEVSVDEEISRTAPVIGALREGGLDVAISIDTRKAAVARAALEAGASWVNDVTALRFDPDMAALVAEKAVPVILMHSIATPATMQDDPRYENVLLDVYDALAARVAEAEAAGIVRANIAIDPGIGFGKTLTHNLALLQRMSLFHNLGLPVLLGASRKRFIGTIGAEAEAARRMPGSLAVALWGVAQGVQMIRVHDVAETRQALSLWQATSRGDAL